MLSVLLYFLHSHSLFKMNHNKLKVDSTDRFYFWWAHFLSHLWWKAVYLSTLQWFIAAHSLPRSTLFTCYGNRESIVAAVLYIFVSHSHQQYLILAICKYWFNKSGQEKIMRRLTMNLCWLHISDHLYLIFYSHSLLSVSLGNNSQYRFTLLDAWQLMNFSYPAYGTTEEWWNPDSGAHVGGHVSL